MAIANS